jgi:hypothetical protein
MKTIVQCKMCAPSHDDHWECNECHAWLSGLFDPCTTVTPGHILVKWKFCPFCGARLEPDSEEHHENNIVS